MIVFVDWTNSEIHGFYYSVSHFGTDIFRQQLLPKETTVYWIKTCFIIDENAI